MATTPKPISPSVIGRQTNTGLTPAVPTATPTPAATVPVNPNLASKIKTKLGAIQGFPKLTGAGVSSIASAEVYNDAQLTVIGRVLKKLGYPVKPTTGSIKTLLTTEPELIELTGRFPIYSDLVTKLTEQYLPGLDGGTTAAPNLPSRQVYQYSDETIGTLVDSAFQTQYGRVPTPEEKAAKTASIRKELEVGTLSTTKKVKNPKTGKLESVTTQQQQGITTADATTKLEEQLKASNPEAYQRNKALEFNADLQKIMAGGM
jgi:hypothetical protein